MEENIAAHTKWMQETHHREGDKVLHVLNWSSAPEMKDEVEADNITFVLTEVYETMAGVDHHFQKAQNSLSMPHDMSEGLVLLTICDRRKYQTLTVERLIHTGPVELSSI